MSTNTSSSSTARATRRSSDNTGKPPNSSPPRSPSDGASKASTPQTRGGKGGSSKRHDDADVPTSSAASSVLPARDNEGVVSWTRQQSPHRHPPPPPLSPPFHSPAAGTATTGSVPRAGGSLSSTASPRRTGGGPSTTTASAASSSSRQRRQRQPPPDPPPPPPPPSLTDQIAASALSGTVELLKLATGVTLNTTSKLYAPSWQVTRAVVLPGLGAALAEYLEQVAPKRVQDWFRIVSSSVCHVVDVFVTQDAPCGKTFRAHFAEWWISLWDCVSSDSSRQLLVDGAAAWAKLAEALHTPEVHAFFRQMAVLGCRVVDAASSGKTKEWVYNTTELWWSGCELLADPHTTCALAEVTAYLCHALEMEQAHLREDPSSTRLDPHVSTSSSANSLEKPPRHQHQRKRQRRDALQRSTYHDPVLINTPHATVEQAILSSLGARCNDPNDTEDLTDYHSEDENDDEDIIEYDHDDDGSSLPSRTDPHNVKTAQQVGGDNDHWYQRVKDGVKNDVNVDYLQARIHQRARRKGREQHEQQRSAENDPSPPTEIRTKHPDPWVTRLANGNNPNAAAPIAFPHTTLGSGLISKTSHKIELKLDDAEADQEDVPNEEPLWPRPPHPERLDGESPSEHFYRVLDEILVQQRTSSLKWVVSGAPTDTSQQPNDDIENVTCQGQVRKANETFRDHIAALRAEIEAEKKQLKQKRDKNIAGAYRFLAYLPWIGLLLGIVIFFGFGIYGMYAFARGQLQAFDSTKRFSSAPSPELVVRVVREVIHVDAKGKVFDHDVAPWKLSTEEADKVSSCIAQAL